MNVLTVSVRKSVDLCGMPPNVVDMKECLVCWISCCLKKECSLLVLWSAKMMLRYD